MGRGSLLGLRFGGRGAAGLREASPSKWNPHASPRWAPCEVEASLGAKPLLLRRGLKISLEGIRDGGSKTPEQAGAVKVFAEF